MSREDILQAIRNGNTRIERVPVLWMMPVPAGLKKFTADEKRQFIAKLQRVWNCGILEDEFGLLAEKETLKAAMKKEMGKSDSYIVIPDAPDVDEPAIRADERDRCGLILDEMAKVTESAAAKAAYILAAKRIRKDVAEKKENEK